MNIKKIADGTQYAVFVTGRNIRPGCPTLSSAHMESGPFNTRREADQEADSMNRASGSNDYYSAGIDLDGSMWIGR